MKIVKGDAKPRLEMTVPIYDFDKATLWMSKYGVITFVRYSSVGLGLDPELRSTTITPTPYRFGLDPKFMGYKWAAGNTIVLDNIRYMRDQLCLGVVDSGHIDQVEDLLNGYPFEEIDFDKMTTRYFISDPELAPSSKNTYFVMDLSDADNESKN